MASIKSFINFENKYDRVIVLVDMDCFYCQVEEKLNPELLAGKPIAVVQYNEWKGGGIIAVNYPARASGVSRHMRGDEAKEHCPEIVLCKVPNVRGKADLTKYRDAGKEVAQVLQTFTPLLERASVDEAYLDITDSVLIKLREMNAGNYKLDASKFTNTHAVGYESMGSFVQDLTNRCASTEDDGPHIFENESEYEKTSFKRSDLKLLIGAAIVNDIRAAVKEKTGYNCSAGIAHNKILAKLTAGMHKPNQQTVLPVRSIPELYATLPITKVKGLGGKFGEEVCEALKIKLMAQLATIPKEALLQRFDEKNGNWLYLISRGVDLENLTPRYTAKSIACCKRFPGKSAIMGMASLNHWLSELATEICERMEKDSLENNRKAKQMVVSYTQAICSEDISSSRTVALNVYEPQLIAREALEVIKRNTAQFFKVDNPGTLNNHIKFLGISVSKFEDTTKSDTLKEMFKNQLKKANPVLDLSPSTSKECENVNNETASQSSETTLAEIMMRKKRSNSIESFAKTEATSSVALVRKSKSLLESMFANQKKQKTEIEPNQSSEIPVKQIEEMDPALNDKEDSIECNVQIIDVEQEKNRLNESSTSKINEQHSGDFEKIKDEHLTSCEPSTSKNVDDDDEEDIILPEIEIPLIRCEICKRKIPEDELPAHNDYHFALQLSQQQRQEFRNEMKSKFSPQLTKSKDAKTKVANKLTKPNALPSIATFLKKKADTTEDIDKNAVKCEECGKMVQDIIEHSDYHLAKKLQQELSRTSVPQTSQATNGTKRKRSNSRSDKTNPVKVKPLTSFFSKAD